MRRGRCSRPVWSRHDRPPHPRSIRRTTEKARGTRLSHSVAFASGSQKGSSMDFEYSIRSKDLQDRVAAFMQAHVYPNEHVYAQQLETVARYRTAPIVRA